MENTMINLLRNHTSIRKFQDRDVEEELKKKVIESTRMVPTSNNLQTYTIIEVKDKDKRRKLAKIAGGQVWVEKAPLVFLFCADLHRSKKYIDVGNTDIFGNVESYTVAAVDTALAAQRAFIAAQSLGLGGVIVGGIRNDMEGVHKLFELPDLVAPLFLLVLGYPDENPDLKPRLPKDVIHKVDFYDEAKDDSLVNEYNEIMKVYYGKRTKDKPGVSWSEKSKAGFTPGKRDAVGNFLRGKGFLES